VSDNDTLEFQGLEGAMCWADRVALFWAALVYLFFFLLAGNARDDMLAWFISPDGLKLLLICVAIPWALLRLIDWALLDGPRRRRLKARSSSRR
jgi:hypothetical protein